MTRRTPNLASIRASEMDERKLAAFSFLLNELPRSRFYSASIR